MGRHVREEKARDSSSHLSFCSWISYLHNCDGNSLVHSRNTRAQNPRRCQNCEYPIIFEVWITPHNARRTVFTLLVYIRYSPAGRGVFWKKICAWDLHSATLKMEGTVFPNTDQALQRITQQIRPSLWWRSKNSVRCRDQSNCMIYRIAPTRALRIK